MFRIFCILLVFFIFSCSNKTIYSGKILNQEDLSNINFKNKDILIKEMGNPSFIDPVENKFFYHSEKINKKSVFDKETIYNYIFIFEFDDKDTIVNTRVYDLKNSKDAEFIDNVTENQVVKRGLLERIFGGVGPQQGLPTTP